MKAHALFMHKTYEKEKSEKRITISLYNLFIKHLGGGTGLQIICNILELLDIKSLANFIFTSFLHRFCKTRKDGTLAQIVMDKMIIPCKIKFMKKVKQRKEMYKEKCPKGKPFIVACQLGYLGDVKLFVAAHDEKVTGVSLKQMINMVGRNSSGEFLTPLDTAVMNDRRNIVEYFGLSTKLKIKKHIYSLLGQTIHRVNGKWLRLSNKYNNSYESKMHSRTRILAGQLRIHKTVTTRFGRKGVFGITFIEINGGVYVMEVLVGGLAADCPYIQPANRLIKINEIDVSITTLADVVKLLTSVGTPVVLTWLMLSDFTISDMGAAIKAAKQSAKQTKEADIQKKEAARQKKEAARQARFTRKLAVDREMCGEPVSTCFDSEGAFGIEFIERDGGVYVKDVLRQSLASKHPEIQCKNRLIKINEINVSIFSLADIIKLLTSSVGKTRPVVFTWLFLHEVTIYRNSEGSLLADNARRDRLLISLFGRQYVEADMDRLDREFRDIRLVQECCLQNVYKSGHQIVQEQRQIINTVLRHWKRAGVRVTYTPEIHSKNVANEDQVRIKYWVSGKIILSFERKAFDKKNQYNQGLVTTDLWLRKSGNAKQLL